MLSGDWEAATTAWDSALKARHGPKRMALFYRSLTAHLAGDHERADAGFTTLINWGGRDEMAARYWRIRAREAAGKTNTMADRTRIASTAKAGWYQLLLQPPQPQGEGWVVRDGRWGGQPTVSLLNGNGLRRSLAYKWAGATPRWPLKSLNPPRSPGRA